MITTTATPAPGNTDIPAPGNTLICIVKVLKFNLLSLYLIRTPIFIDILNEGIDCWGGCAGTQGLCPWCGSDGWCCRLEWVGNGCDGNMGSSDYAGHVCTTKGKHTHYINSELKLSFVNNYM